jgi:uncharacterized protein (TIGR02448 family)
MIRQTLIAALIACVAVAPAFAGSSSAGSAASAVGTSASSHTTSPGNNKMLLQARDDAASFVASDGRLRGAQLESALRYLREHDAQAQRASDMQLAKAILAL